MFNPEKVLPPCVCLRVCAECVEYLAIATLVEQRNLPKKKECAGGIWLSVGHFDIFHLFVGILFGFGSCFRGLAARHNRLRLIPPQFSIK